ncbi:tail fiber domain-containing protein [Winogradskyella sp. SYSU M77433]|uniref:tail fiber domain-containing protein n=1 Tax=Winogradskyella sp. SYSU M77433 TaxID=3042722 RepID=UPI002480296F|nr:tail fiber domain-containing protein [Winogradskyella sp. SYSU M77433]MDH7911287.1 tail fiber domain-containing protein [Winogradskyella sp. SYSU M77433]
MKYRIKIWHFFFLLPVLISAQVGVNTTNPNALLDISTSNPSSPNNTDGLLIPKIDEYPSINPTAIQDGMLVYVTGNGSVTKGFYYWDNNTTSWVSFAGTTIEKIDDLLDGKSDDDGTNDGSSIFLGVDAGANDDGTDNGNIGLGFEALKANTSGLRNVAVGHRSLFSNSTGSTNSALGATSMYSNLSGYSNTAIGRSAMFHNTDGYQNVALGYYAGFFNNGNNNVFVGYQAGSYSSNTMIGGVFIGANSGRYETNDNRLYIENSTSSSPLIYGEFDTDFLRINGDFEVEKTTNASATVVTPFGYQSSLKLFERGGSGDYGFEFQYDGSPDKLYLWSRTFAGNEGIRMTWLKDGRVGMNDTAPDARLDIEAINQATPTNTDGILIPRIDVFPATNPGINQNGMLVFLTSDNSFYYWNNSATTWVNLMNSSNAVERINDLADGKSDNDGTNNGSSIFLGVDAGANDDLTDNRNIAIGYQSMQDNNNGNNNSAFGYLSLTNNTNGDYNVAIGNRSLMTATIGNQNTAVGFEALETNNGNYNTAVGYIALDSNSNGDGNTSVGNQALSSNTSGDYNTSIGYRSLLDNSSGDQNVAVGYHALQNNTTGNNNVAIGYNSLNLVTTGYSNTALGTSAGAAGATFYNTTALGNGAAPNSPNQVRLGNSSVSVIGGYANWSNFSDRRLKTNIQENIVGLEFIKKLRPVSYNYDMDAIARFENTPDSLRIREAEKLKIQEIQTGFIAQEVEQAAQAVGFDFHGVVKPYDENGTYALRYAEFVVPLVKAMQEQQEIIETQNQELKSLREEIEAIKALLKENYKID